MPNIYIGPYRVGFYEYDLKERPHMHVKRERMEAKFWLTPSVMLARNRGFAEHELRSIERLLEENAVDLLAWWQEEKSKHAN